LTAAGLFAVAGARAQEGPAPTPTPVPSPAPSPEPPSPPAPPPMPGPSSGGAVNPTFFNPAIAVIGNFLATAGRNPVDNQPSFQSKESEISFQAVVDPYARADFFVSISNAGVELEEGYVTFLHLPLDLLVKAGKFKAQFGKVNTLHLHVLPWADEPLPIVNLLGSEEGWADAGMSVAKLIELPGDTFSELTGQVFAGSVSGLFDAPSRSKVAWAGQYRVYRDLGDDHNLEIGASYGRGFNGVTTETTTSLQNFHLVYRWKPLQGRPYRSFILRGEYFRSLRQQSGPTQIAAGYFVSGDYQLARRWFVGARYEWSGHSDDATRHDRGEALTITFWPSEFSQIRGELRQRRYAGGIMANEALLQIQYAIGAHGAHPF
ncbi:MAG: hypothetical protein WAU32_07995, partial [Thermoanaerobaculia bacterium]